MVLTSPSTSWYAGMQTATGGREGSGTGEVVMSSRGTTRQLRFPRAGACPATLPRAGGDRRGEPEEVGVLREQVHGEEVQRTGAQRRDPGPLEGADASCREGHEGDHPHGEERDRREHAVREVDERVGVVEAVQAGARL